MIMGSSFHSVSSYRIAGASATFVLFLAILLASQWWLDHYHNCQQMARLNWIHRSKDNINYDSLRQPNKKKTNVEGFCSIDFSVNSDDQTGIHRGLLNEVIFQILIKIGLHWIIEIIAGQFNKAELDLQYQDWTSKSPNCSSVPNATIPTPTHRPASSDISTSCGSLLMSHWK